MMGVTMKTLATSNHLKSGMNGTAEPESSLVQTWDHYFDLKTRYKEKVIPAVEIILSKVLINNLDPGYEKPAIRIQTIFSGNGKTKSAKASRHFEERKTSRKENDPPNSGFRAPISSDYN